MKLTVVIVALNVAEELAEASVQGCVPLHPTQSGAHPLSVMVGADLVISSLQNMHNKSICVQGDVLIYYILSHHLFKTLKYFIYDINIIYIDIYDLFIILKQT